ncbi:MAG: DUF3575 domain-containing protein [Muribaculaceae bacterium]|nr:DUF3575 domain-containing protein [Muribaculaceae bacterium]
MKLKLCVALLMALFAGMFASAQKVALKTNLLYDATATVNAGIEIGLAPRWTLDISGNFNDWTMSHNRKWKHWLVQPEARYWFCERFSGHFIGIHAHGGEYNFGNLKNGIKFLGSDFSKLTDNRYQGWYVGGGLSYGYAWILGKHWNLEAELGIGYIYTRFDKYPCAECGEKIEEDASHHYFGPTKLALSIVYLF